MSAKITEARTNISAMVNDDVMPRFVVAKPYLDYVASKAPKPPARPTTPAPSKPPDLTAAKTAVLKMEVDISAGSTYFTTATKTLKAKGLPEDREEVNRMFESGRLRHDKVHTPYTALPQKDKGLTKANFAAFFAKKEAFTKQWGEYRKLLGR